MVCRRNEPRSPAQTLMEFLGLRTRNKAAVSWAATQATCNTDRISFSCPPVIKHGWLENGPFIGDFPIKTSIQFGDLPLPCWLPDGKRDFWVENIRNRGRSKLRPATTSQMYSRMWYVTDIVAGFAENLSHYIKLSKPNLTEYEYIHGASLALVSLDHCIPEEGSGPPASGGWNASVS